MEDDHGQQPDAEHAEQVWSPSGDAVDEHAREHRDRERE